MFWGWEDSSVSKVFVFQHEDMSSTILGKVAQACSLRKSQEDPWAHWLASLAQLVSSRTMKVPVSKEVNDRYLKYLSFPKVY